MTINETGGSLTLCHLETGETFDEQWCTTQGPASPHMTDYMK